MSRHLPAAEARQHAQRMATKAGADLALNRVSLGLTINQVARRAAIAPSTVARVIGGDGGAHLDTICAVALAVGMRISVKAFPGTPRRCATRGS